MVRCYFGTFFMWWILGRRPMEDREREGRRKMCEVVKVEEIFASKVFTFGKMKERLPRSVYKEVRKIMDQGGELSLRTAPPITPTGSSPSLVLPPRSTTLS